MGAGLVEDRRRQGEELVRTRALLDKAAMERQSVRESIGEGCYEAERSKRGESREGSRVVGRRRRRGDRIELVGQFEEVDVKGESDMERVQVDQEVARMRSLEPTLSGLSHKIKVRCEQPASPRVGQGKCARAEPQGGGGSTSRVGMGSTREC